MNWNNYGYSNMFYGNPQGCSGTLALIVCLIILLLTGCKHIEYVSVPELHTDTLYINKTEHDSIYVKDSIYIHEWSKGDTVYIEQLRWQTKWREKLRTDTIRESRVDSVAVPYPVIKTKATGWWAFWGLVAALIAIVAIILLRIVNRQH